MFCLKTNGILRSTQFEDENIKNTTLILKKYPKICTIEKIIEYVQCNIIEHWLLLIVIINEWMGYI